MHVEMNIDKLKYHSGQMEAPWVDDYLEAVYRFVLRFCVAMQSNVVKCRMSVALHKESSDNLLK